MSRRTYNTGTCWLCGHQLSNAGLAVASHNRMHVRQGLMSEKIEWIDGHRRIDFHLTDAGKQYAARVKVERPCSCTAKDGKPCRFIATVEGAKADGQKQMVCIYHQWGQDYVNRKPLKMLELEPASGTEVANA